MLPPDGGPDYNRLIHEQSPYLLQHAALRLIFYQYRRTTEPRLLKMAVKTLDAMANGGIHDHVGGGGYFFTASDSENLLARPKDPFDQAIPSGNGVAAQTLLRLAKITGKKTYRSHASAVLQAFGGIMARAPRGTVSLCLAAAMSLDETSPSKPATDKPDARVEKKPLTIEALISQPQIAPGKTFSITLKFVIEHGWHINSHAPLQDYLIPTSVEFVSGPAKAGTIIYPPGKNIKLPFSPEPLSVYEGTFTIQIPMTLSRRAQAGPTTLALDIQTQACDDKSCQAPKTHRLDLAIEVDNQPPAKGEIVGNRSPDQSPPVENAGFWQDLKNFKTREFIARYGYALAFVAMFLLGVGLCLTPCVYPIVPITIGYFGMQAKGHWTSQLGLASLFGLGIAISYAAIGTVAALTGSLMGALLQNVIVLMILAGLCTVMGLNAFGLFELRMPSFLMNLTGSSRAGLLGALIMGLTMGIAAAPCLAAFIVSLLAYVGQKGSVGLGFALFGSLGLGLAFPFVLLGTFSGLAAKMPQSGGWLVFVKKVMGSLLFGAALYFLNTVIPARFFNPLVLVALTAGGLYFGFFEKTPVATVRFRIVRLLLAAVFLGAAFWWGGAEQAVPSGPTINWKTYTDENVEQAKTEGKTVVIDFYADWCLPCKELDRFTFSDPRVIEASSDMLMLKVDLTRGDSPRAKELTRRYNVLGVPTIVFIGPDGRERPDLRIVQYESAAVVIERLKAIQH